MPLTCWCEDPDDADAPWGYWEPKDYTTMPQRKRRARCSSCFALIDHGSMVAEFKRARGPRSEIEERIYGADLEAIDLASHYFCETCADLFFSLRELGFCVGPGEDQRELAREYAEMRKKRI